MQVHKVCITVWFTIVVYGIRYCINWIALYEQYNLYVCNRAKLVAKAKGRE